MGINGHVWLRLEPACLPGGKNSLNSHRRHSRTSANYFPTEYCWVIAKPATTPGSGTPHTCSWQRSGCSRSIQALMARACLSASSLWFLDKRPLGFLSLWKSMGLYFFLEGILYALQRLLQMNFGLNTTLQDGVCVCWGWGWGNFKYFRAQKKFVTLHVFPSLLTNQCTLTPCLESETLPRQCIGPQDS